MGRTVAEVLDMDPRDLATMIDLQQEHDAARLRSR